MIAGGEKSVKNSGLKNEVKKPLTIPRRTWQDNNENGLGCVDVKREGRAEDKHDRKWGAEGHSGE